MKVLAFLTAFLGIGVLAARPAAVVVLIVIAAVGGFLAGATGRVVWKGEDR